MSYSYFLFAYAGPFVALAVIYLIWAYTAFRWREKNPRYYEWVCKANGWLPKIIVSILIAGFVLNLFDVL